MASFATALRAVFLVQELLFLAVALAAVVGAVSCALTRGDAFQAADRQSKWVWVALLGGSALVCSPVMAPGLFIFALFGAVVVGVYWFDVRPQIRSILDGTYGW